jgi:glycosyltransferase involved in cell wall biosynthesis
VPRLRVTFVAPFGTRRLGTTRARVLPLASALAARGHAVRVLVPSWDCPEEQRWHYRCGAAEVIHLPRTSSTSPLVALGLLADCYRLALAGEPHVVHCFKPIGYSGAATLGLRAASRRRRWAGLLAVDCDDLEGRGGWAERVGRPSWQVALLDWQERASLQAAKLITVASRYLGARAARRGYEAHRLLYLPNAVEPWPEDSPTPVTDQKRSHPTVLLYTRFNEFDSGRAADLLTTVLQNHVDARLGIVGDGGGPDGRTFLSRFDTEGLSNRVTYHGMLDGRVLRRALSGDHVSLWLFDDTAINRARSPVKLLELMAAGNAIVAEAAGEVAALAQHAVRLVPQGDAYAILSAIVELLDDANARRLLGRRARVHVAKSASWADRAAALEACYLDYT